MDAVLNVIGNIISIAMCTGFTAIIIGFVAMVIEWLFVY